MDTGLDDQLSDCDFVAALDKAPLVHDPDESLTYKERISLLGTPSEFYKELSEESCARLLEMDVDADNRLLGNTFDSYDQDFGNLAHWAVENDNVTLFQEIVTNNDYLLEYWRGKDGLSPVALAAGLSKVPMLEAIKKHAASDEKNIAIQVLKSGKTPVLQWIERELPHLFKCEGMFDVIFEDFEQRKETVVEVVSWLITHDSILLKRDDITDSLHEWLIKGITNNSPSLIIQLLRLYRVNHLQTITVRIEALHTESHDELSQKLLVLVSAIRQYFVLDKRVVLSDGEAYAQANEQEGANTSMTDQTSLRTGVLQNAQRELDATRLSIRAWVGYRRLQGNNRVLIGDARGLFFFTYGHLTRNSNDHKCLNLLNDVARERVAEYLAPRMKTDDSQHRSLSIVDGYGFSHAFSIRMLCQWFNNCVSIVLNYYQPLLDAACLFEERLGFSDTSKCVLDELVGCFKILIISPKNLSAGTLTLLGKKVSDTEQKWQKEYLSKLKQSNEKGTRSILEPSWATMNQILERIKKLLVDPHHSIATSPTSKRFKAHNGLCATTHAGGEQIRSPSTTPSGP